MLSKDLADLIEKTSKVLDEAEALLKRIDEASIKSINENARRVIERYQKLEENFDKRRLELLLILVHLVNLTKKGNLELDLGVNGKWSILAYADKIQGPIGPNKEMITLHVSHLIDLARRGPLEEILNELYKGLLDEIIPYMSGRPRRFLEETKIFELLMQQLKMIAEPK